MDHLMREYIARFKKPNIDGDQLLRKLNALPDTPAGFLQLNGILGKQGAGFSWDDYTNSERILAEQDKTKAQKAMERESLTKAFAELHSGKVHHDTRKLFAE